jgi:hypothetical protein
LLDRKVVMNESLWKVFTKLVKAVREDHGTAGALVGTGHDFTHALMAAQYCLQITDEDDPLATLGWLAGICHNTDRLFPNESVESRVWNYLSFTNLFSEEKDLIIEAVLNHSHKPSPDDLPLTIVLMDADKLANLGFTLALRSAQFQPNLPPINLTYLFEYPPGHNYKNPGSICRDIASSLEWREGWFRLPKAIKLAEPLFAQLEQFLQGVLKQFKDTGLFPYPFSEDFE